MSSIKHVSVSNINKKNHANIKTSTQNRPDIEYQKLPLPPSYKQHANRYLSAGMIL